MLISHPNLPEKGSIIVQTRLGSDIANAQWLELDERQLQTQNLRFKRKFPYATFVNAPTGIYNCHGLAFASRRTQICEPSEVQKIIREDGYRLIDRREDVQPGDIILYLGLTQK